eukprot:m51a1_g6861 hypothetical protein (710) ;mRNA; r:136919-139677
MLHRLLPRSKGAAFAPNSTDAAACPDGQPVLVDVTGDPPVPRRAPQDCAAPRRVDIQVLRALAVTAVLCFHLGFGWMRGGFVGVDVFFVISGYLVFGSVAHGLEGKKYSLVEFYARRAKRLNPPSAVMLLVLLCVLWKSSYCSAHAGCRAQYDDIRWAALQGANLNQLAKQGGYFDDAEPSIVLHFWSLAVEEQLYVAVPLLLAALRLVLGAEAYGRAVGPFMAATSLASFCSMFVQTGKWRFYFVASRYWEFGLGALVAYYERHASTPAAFARAHCPRRALLVLLYAVGWAALVVACVLVPSGSYPNVLTLPVCAVTAFLISCKMEYRAPVLKQVGDLSYSVYLYHWPAILLCAHYMGISMSQKPVWLAALIFTVTFSCTSYWLVEMPLQKRKLRCRSDGAPGGTNSSDVMRIPWTTDGNPYSAETLRKKAFVTLAFNSDPFWKNLIGEGPDVPVVPRQRLHVLSNSTVWTFNGDSHMMQFWKMLYKYGEKLGASMYVGGIPHYNKRDFEVMWNPPDFWSGFSTRISFLSWRQHIPPSMKGDASWEDDFKRYTRVWIEQSNCTVVLVDNPMWVLTSNLDDDLARSPLECLKTKDASQCASDPAEVLPSREIGWLRSLLAERPELRDKVEMVSFNDLVCWGGKCHAHVYDIPIYFDCGHYSIEYTDFAYKYIISRMRSSKCIQSLESHMGTEGLLDRVYGPRYPPQTIL